MNSKETRAEFDEIVRKTFNSKNSTIDYDDRWRKHIISKLPSLSTTCINDIVNEGPRGKSSGWSQDVFNMAVTILFERTVGFTE